MGLEEIIIRDKRINDIQFLNKYFEGVNSRLKIGGIFKGNVEVESDKHVMISSGQKIDPDLDGRTQYSVWLNPEFDENGKPIVDWGDAETI